MVRGYSLMTSHIGRSPICKDLSLMSCQGWLGYLRGRWGGTGWKICILVWPHLWTPLVWGNIYKKNWRIVLYLRHKCPLFQNEFELPSDGEEMGDGGRGNTWGSFIDSVIKFVPGNECLPPTLLRPRGVATFFVAGDFAGVLRPRFGVLTVVDIS